MNAVGGSFSHPQTNLERVGISEGSVVADLGSGSGHYAQAAATMVGPAGRVFAVEVQQELVTRLADMARREHMNQLEVLHGDIERIGGSKLGSETIDTTLVCNVLFQIEDKKAFVQEVVRITRPNGRVCIIDWADSNFGLGPDTSLIVTESAARDLFADHFEFVKDFEAGDHHYGLVMRKK